MKKLFATALLFLVPVLSHAAYTGQQLVEAQAVLSSSEIAAHLQIEKKLHNLGCERATLNDVQIKPDADMDFFEIVYACNDVRYGANVQRIHFIGGVYTQSPTAKAADVVLTRMQIELSE